jgi:hypothetical protein
MFAPPARIAYEARCHAGMTGRGGEPKRAHGALRLPASEPDSRKRADFSDRIIRTSFFQECTT